MWSWSWGCSYRLPAWFVHSQYTSILVIYYHIVLATVFVCHWKSLSLFSEGPCITLTKETSFNSSLQYHLHNELSSAQWVIIIIDHVQIIAMGTLGGVCAICKDFNYYASIMLDAFLYLLCWKLCLHYWHSPTCEVIEWHYKFINLLSWELLLLADSCSFIASYILWLVITQNGLHVF